MMKMNTSFKGLIPYRNARVAARFREISVAILNDVIWWKKIWFGIIHSQILHLQAQWRQILAVEGLRSSKYVISQQSREGYRERLKTY